MRRKHSFVFYKSIALIKKFFKQEAAEYTILRRDLKIYVFNKSSCWFVQIIKQHRNTLSLRTKVNSVHSDDMGRVLHCDESKNGYSFSLHASDKFEFPFIQCIFAVSTA